MKKLGYCKQCLRNVPHTLFFRWPVLNILNRFPEFSGTLWFSSWNCCACEKHIYILRKPVPEATTDLTSTEMSDVRPFRESRSNSRQGMFLSRLFPPPELDPETIPQADSATDEAGKQTSTPVGEKVGNFLRSEESLVVRNTRAARYTKKYRESVVERILSGQATITQVRSELGITERDVLEWINDRVYRQHQKIAKLTQVVKTVRQLTIESEEITDDPRQEKIEVHPPEIKLFKNKSSSGRHSSGSKAADQSTIEGSVKPRKSNP